MTFYALAALINFVTSTIFGLLVFIRNPRNKINYSYALFAFGVAFWSLCYFIWQISNTASDALFWTKALMAFAIFIPAFYSHFVFVFTGLTKRKILLLILAYVLLGTFLPLNIFGSLFIQEVKPLLGFKFWPIAGPLFHAFLAIWMGYVIFDTYLLYKAHQKATGIAKDQIKYVFWGLGLAFFGGITNYFLWYQIPIPPFANILVSAYVTLTAIAIVRHRLMDIRLILARTIVYSIIIAGIALIYTGFAFLASSIFMGFEIDLRRMAIYLVLTFVLALSFSRLRHIIEGITDRLLFKGHYDSNQLLSQFGTIMSSHIELNDLSSRILNTLTKEMRISHGSLILLEKDAIYGVAVVGFTTPPAYTYSELIQVLVPEQPVIFDEMPEGELKQMMRVLNASVTSVLRVKTEVVGVLILGEKASGETYSGEDLKVLEILTPEVAVAFANAKSVDKIKRFNITLSEEVKKATSDLQNANNRLKELDKLKDDFVSIASHELRTPMTAIKSYLWMAIYKPDMKLTEKMNKYISRAYISTERLINLVNDMLNVSRIEAGRIEIRPQVFDIATLIDEVMGEVTAKAVEKMIKLNVVKSQTPQVFADPDKVHQVLLNLVGNSLKFVSTDGEISISFFADGQFLDISVKDNGVGISKDDLSKLFQKFGRLDSSYVAAATAGGTGLGLFITKNLVELMGGKVWATSEGLGKGTTFTFSLPIANQKVLAEAEKYTKKPMGEAKGLEPVVI